MTISLTEAEYRYLHSFIQENGCNQSIAIKSIDIIIDEAEGAQLTDQLTSDLPNHFSNDYEPTETGTIIESIIDKLYLNNSFTYRTKESLFQLCEEKSRHIIIQIDSNINDKRRIINIFSRALGCTSTPTDWADLQTCLCDLAWNNRPSVLIIHFGLPLLNKNDLQMYIEMLEYVERFWYHHQHENQNGGGFDYYGVHTFFIDELQQRVSSIIDDAKQKIDSYLG